MSYTRVNWQNGSSGGTPLSATNLNIMDAGIETLDTNKEDTTNKVTSLSSSSTDTEYPSAKCVYDELEDKADSSTTYTKTETDNLLANKENTSNKVTSLSASSTDTQYPSAKCVYDELANKATTTALAKTDRSLDMLWKLNEGQTYDFDVDSESVYAKTVPSGAKYDSVDMIGGKSAVFNQLLEHGNFDSLSSWYCDSTRATLSISNNVLTATIVSTGAVTLRSNLSCVSGHKYVVFFSIKPKNTSAVAITVGNSSSTTSTSALVADSWNSVGIIKESGSSEQYLRIRVDASTGYSVGDTFGVKNVNVIDLTQMFGSGNEPSTVAEFKAMFPADYYAYNTGEVVSAVVDNVNVVGKNMLSISATGRTVYGVTFTKNSSGSLSLAGMSNSGAQAYYYMGGASTLAYNTAFTLETGKTYTFSAYTTSGTINVGARKIDASGNISVISNTFTAESGYRYEFFVAKALVSGTTYDEEITAQLEYGSTATTYSAYTSTDYAIPLAIRSLDGYGQGFGSSYNYVDYAEKKYHKVGSWVDGAWTPLATEVVTDISSMLTDGFLENLDVEANGTITFENTLTDMLLPVPATNEFIIKIDEVG